MRSIREWCCRLWGALRGGRTDADLEQELRTHLELAADEARRRGETPFDSRADALAEGRRAATIRVGGVPQAMEHLRDARGIRVFAEIAQDLSYGVRMLHRRKLSSAAAIATIALGIGLNAAVFSVVDWVLLRPLPYPSAPELVSVLSGDKTSPAGSGMLTFAELQAVSAATTLRAAMAFSTATRVLSGGRAEPAHVVVARVTGDLFGTLGLHPVAGRALSREDTQSGAPLVIVSEGLWRRRWSADARAIGDTVTIDGRPHTVIGVMPAGRGYPKDADVWRPITAAEREDDDRELAAIARLAVDTSQQRAETEISTLVRNGVMRLEGLQRSEVAGVQEALIALFVSSGLILIIACANVAGLLGARTADRASEFSVRSALGAGRPRLLRQLITETVLLAAAGGAAGLVLGHFALDLVVRLAPAAVPRLAEVSLDIRIVAIGMAATLVVGLVVALIAVRSVSRRLQDGPARWTGARVSPSARGSRALVGVQASVAIVLTVGAGLFARSLQQLVEIDHGFDPEHLVAIELTLRGMDPAESSRLLTGLVESAQAVPRVQSAAAAMRLPNQLASLRVPVELMGQAPRRTPPAVLRAVTPGYFATVGLPLRSGRGFLRDDRRGAPRVAVVNAAFVRDILQGAPAPGTRVRMSLFDDEFTVVGEVSDVTPAGESDRPAVYVSMTQVMVGGGSLLIRTAASPSAVIPDIVARLRSAAPALAFDRVHDMAEVMAGGRAAARFSTRLASAFAALALMLAAVGVYGLTAGEVVGRWRELGVRLALGATRLEAFWIAMRPSATMIAIGGSTGLAAAIVAARWMRSLLHGIGPADGVVLISAPVLFAAVGLTASALAAARVLKADPATILRVD